jgi:hypothetical protein
MEMLVDQSFTFANVKLMAAVWHASNNLNFPDCKLCQLKLIFQPFPRKKHRQTSFSSFILRIQQLFLE